MAEREASNQKMVGRFRRDMEVSKGQAHARKVAQEMVVREQNRFGKMAAYLEREALKLGEDVQRLMKSGKEMSTVRLGQLFRMLCDQYMILRGSSSRRELNLGLG